MLRPVAIVAASLSAAGAFLLPPELRITSHGLALAQERNHTLSLDCPGCPVPLMGDGGKIIVTNAHKSHLDLNFRIDNGGKQPRLLVNEFEIFPHPDPVHNALIAKHVPEDGDSAAAVPVTLGASLGWHREPTSKKTPMTHFVVDLQIIEILSGFQDGIPNVKIDLVHCGHSGRLRIADIRQTESTARKHVPLAQQLAECGDSWYCKVRAVMLDKFRKVSAKMGMGHKGCKHHGQMGAMGGHHGHHGHHNHHGHMEGPASSGNKEVEKPHFKLREHNWSQLWTKFAHHILFPIGVGIVAGISVSLVVMVIGTLIVGLWRVFVRGQPFFHRRRHAHRRSKSASVSEKAALMANVEELPAYRDEEPKENN